jgi:hypothetical protein
MALRLSENPINPEDVIENLVEEDQRNVQLFFVENFESEI